MSISTKNMGIGLVVKLEAVKVSRLMLKLNGILRYEGTDEQRKDEGDKKDLTHSGEQANSEDKLNKCGMVRKRKTDAGSQRFNVEQWECGNIHQILRSEAHGEPELNIESMQSS